jgi:hypothetical protein
MNFSQTVNRLVQAQAHAEADPRQTILRLWRDGIVVAVHENGHGIERRISWTEIETARINPIILAIDLCSREMSGSK